MSKSFKSFLFESSEHILDMQLDRFLSFSKDIKKYEVYEKIGGTSYSFGIEGGALYTSKDETSKKYYDISDYEDFPSNNQLKAFHLAISEIQSTIHQYLRDDGIINCIINFDSFGESVITFFQCKSTNKNVIGHIFENISKNIKIETELLVSDGNRITKEIKNLKVKFEKLDRIYHTFDISSELKSLDNFLTSENIIASELLDSTLSNYETLQNRKQELTSERESIRKIIVDEYISNIKERLLKSFFGKSIHSHLGLIFVDKYSRDEIKVINENSSISSIYNFYNNVKDNIIGNQISTDLSSTIDKNGGIIGRGLLRIRKLLNVEGIDSVNKINGILEQFMGNTPKATAINFSNNLKNLSFEAIKKKTESILIYSLNQLTSALENFIENQNSYELEIGNKQIHYTEQVIQDTLLEFTDAKVKIEKLFDKIKESNSMVGLIVALFRDKIRKLHGL